MTQPSWHNAALALCPDGCIHNDDNAERAAKALLAVYPAYDNETAQQAIEDVLCDLRHLCDIMGLCFGDLDQQARHVYMRELEECGVAENKDLTDAIARDLT